MRSSASRRSCWTHHALEDWDWVHISLGYNRERKPIRLFCVRDRGTYKDVFEQEQTSFTNQLTVFDEVEAQIAREFIGKSRFIATTQMVKQDITEEGYDFNGWVLEFFQEQCNGIVQIDGQGFYSPKGELVVDMEEVRESGGAEIHEAVRDQVEHHRCPRLCGAHRDAHQQVSCVRHARVGEQAFHVVLNQHHQVANDHGERRQPGEQMVERRGADPNERRGSARVDRRYRGPLTPDLSSQSSSSHRSAGTSPLRCQSVWLAGVRMFCMQTHSCPCFSINLLSSGWQEPDSSRHS